MTLRKRWRFVTAVFLLCVLGAWTITSLTTPKYSSTTRIYFSTVGAATVGAVGALGCYASQRITSYAERTQGPAVLSAVLKSAAVDESPAELAEQITATVTPNTAVL